MKSTNEISESDFFSKKNQLIKTDEIWWNLMKSDENW